MRGRPRAKRPLRCARARSTDRRHLRSDIVLKTPGLPPPAGSVSVRSGTGSWSAGDGWHSRRVVREGWGASTASVNEARSSVAPGRDWI